MLERLKLNHEQHKKEAFWPSDFEKPVLDLYFAFTDEPKTNPPKWYDTLKWGAGRGVEDSMLTVLKDSGIVNEDYDQKQHGRVEIQREGVQINGYVDAITKDGTPIEIKSINNNNSFDIRRYEKGEPRSNYVGQLSIYMDALGVGVGYLFVSSIDGLHRWMLECKKVGERKYKCANTEVDLDKEYKRWSRLFKHNVEPQVQPQPTEYLYKKPIEEIDWRKLSKTDISKARNNRKVIGDWKVSFSPWKDKIIELQGASLGYTPQELERIEELTKGYTTW